MTTVGSPPHVFPEGVAAPATPKARDAAVARTWMGLMIDSHQAEF